MSITQAASSNLPAVRKSVVGGGCITTAAVAAHVRSTLLEKESRMPQSQLAKKKAVIGGGCITSPSVWAHARQTMTKNRR